MTAPSALALLREVRQAHGQLILRPPDTLEVRIAEPYLSRLLPAIRQRKPDLLMLLARPEGACPAAHSGGYWQDAVGQWHCFECEPNPAWRYLRGVTLEIPGNRPIALKPPTGDLAAPGSWAKSPSGETVEAVLYRQDGREVLTRTLNGERLAWHAPEELLWEIDWGWE